jgi:hypothetical protein
MIQIPYLVWCTLRLAAGVESVSARCRLVNWGNSKFCGCVLIVCDFQLFFFVERSPVNAADMPVRVATVTGAGVTVAVAASNGSAD